MTMPELAAVLLAEKGIRVSPQSLSRWWAAKRLGERKVVYALGALLGVAGAWFVVWQPLTRDLAALRAAAPVERSARAAAQRMADELAGLARNPASRPDAAASQGHPSQSPTVRLDGSKGTDIA